MPCVQARKNLIQVPPLLGRKVKVPYWDKLRIMNIHGHIKTNMCTNTAVRPLDLQPCRDCECSGHGGRQVLPLYCVTVFAHNQVK